MMDEEADSLIEDDVEGKCVSMVCVEAAGNCELEVIIVDCGDEQSILMDGFKSLLFGVGFK